MQITQYIKDHPWATGIIVVVGGFIFLMIFSGGSSSSGSGGNASGPSDAEIAANATIAAAQINAQAQAAQAGAAVQATQIGANVQMNSDNKAAEVAMESLRVQESLGNTSTAAQKEVYIAQTNAKNAQYQSIIGALPMVKKKNRDDILKSLVTGEYGYAGPGYAPGTGAANVIGSIGGAVGSIGSAIGSIGSIFSDQRLKENIVFKGYDKRGLEVYEWNYKGSKKKRLGYIAQSVARSNPKAIHTDNKSGFLMINMHALRSI